MMTTSSPEKTKGISFLSRYEILYGYVDIACCILIVISNTFVILVFTRKNMTSPINTIFIHMVISESLASVSYLPHVWHQHFRIKLCSISEHRTYIWEMISLTSSKLAHTFRDIAVWFALMHAVWRYIAVIHPFKERRWCNMKITRRWIITGYFTIPLSSIPSYLLTSVGSAVKFIDQNGCPISKYGANVSNVTVFEVQIPTENYLILLYSFLLAFYGFSIKLLPSVVFGVISYKLIVTLNQMEKHRKEMVITSNNHNTYNCKVKRQMRKQTDRATKVLIIILALFVMGEIPHGIFDIMSSYEGLKFFWSSYFYMMEFFNMLTLISQSFNFLIYYSMCNQFRNNFKTIFNLDNNKTMISTREVHT